MRSDRGLFAIPSLAHLVVGLGRNIQQIVLLRKAAKGLTVFTHFKLVNHLKYIVLLLLSTTLRWVVCSIRRLYDFFDHHFRIRYLIVSKVYVIRGVMLLSGLRLWLLRDETWVDRSNELLIWLRNRCILAEVRFATLPRGDILHILNQDELLSRLHAHIVLLSSIAWLGQLCANRIEQIVGWCIDYRLTSALCETHLRRLQCSL